MRGVVVRWARHDVADRAIAHDLLRDTASDCLATLSPAVSVHHRCKHCGGDDHGQPSVQHHHRPVLAISVARATGLSVVAVSRRRVGIDVESTDTPVPEGYDLQTWVRTEAILKLTGDGLAIEPSLVGVTAATKRPKLTAWNGPGRRPTLRMADLDIPGYVATVARAGRAPLRVDAAAT